LVISQQETKKAKKSKKFPRYNQRERYDDNSKGKQDGPTNDEDDDNENHDHSDPNQDFTRKGYLLDKDIKELKS
jgi:hypothetical protein